MRSTSTAIASIACSMRSSRAVTSSGNEPEPPMPRSMRRAKARAIGAPIAVTPIMMNRTIGMSSPGTRTDDLRCIDARCGQCESNLGTLADHAGRVHRAIVGEDRLPRDRETEPRSTWLVSHIRLPDAGEPFRLNPAPGITNGDYDAVIAVAPLARNCHADACGSIGVVS